MTDLGDPRSRLTTNLWGICEVGGSNTSATAPVTGNLVTIAPGTTGVTQTIITTGRVWSYAYFNPSTPGFVPIGTSLTIDWSIAAQLIAQGVAH